MKAWLYPHQKGGTCAAGSAPRYQLRHGRSARFQSPAALRGPRRREESPPHRANVRLHWSSFPGLRSPPHSAHARWSQLSLAAHTQAQSRLSNIAPPHRPNQLRELQSRGRERFRTPAWVWRNGGYGSSVKLSVVSRQYSANVGRLLVADRCPLATSHFYYRIVSMNVTLLISFSVVMPERTLSSADSRRNRMPSSRAARRISDVGLRARIISRMRSLKSSNS